jgi:hypothetical protein
MPSGSDFAIRLCAFDVAGYKTGGDITVNHDHERPG